MDDWVNIVAVGTGLVAIAYTIRESRQNNKVLLRVKSCEATGTQSVTENSGNFFHTLKIVVENYGIPLHSVRATISFVHHNEPGRFTLPLKRRPLSGDRDEFAKGMIVEFGFKSYELDRGDRGFLKILSQSTSGDKYLCIYSQDYLAAEFHIGGVSDKMKSRWNSLAYKVNNRFTHKIKRGSHTLTSTPNLLRRVPVLTDAICNICEWVESEESESRKLG
jgi:hypothetical protein